ncbi:MAG: OmpH family outer membrane protein [Bacteroidetes bacterium]|nr:OmpH family outer membrane protein [Bacteroidota bacterium]
MERKHHLIYGSAVLLLAVALVVLVIKPGGQKFGYIEVGKVVENFTMKKELEARMTTTQQQRKTILDSMEIRLRGIAATLPADAKETNPEVQAFTRDRDQYLDLKKRFDEDNLALEQQLNTQLFNQLNQYIKDYGKENGYRYIFGAEGSGTMMYAQENDDLTQQVTAYINSRYKTTK